MAVDSALKVQGRVIYALMMREVHTIYGNSRLGYLWALFQTMTGVLIFWGLRSAMGARAPHGMHILIFLLLGFGFFNMFKGIVSKSMAAVSSNSSLLTYPQVTPVDLMLARCILGWATEVVAGSLIVLGAIQLGVDFQVSHYGLFFFVLLVTPLLGLGIGLTLGSLAVLCPTLNKLVPILLRIMFFTSGLFYAASSLPSHVLDYFWYNPMLQIIDIARYSVSRGYDAILYSLDYLLWLTLASLSLGLLFERYVRGRVK